MKIRFARHTNNLTKLIEFYTKIVGLEITGQFNNHAGYNGVFLGKENFPWELEFTDSNSKTHHEFDDDDILVFYPTSIEELVDINERFNTNRIAKVKPKNPYWQENGNMYLDPDGYRIVISGIKI
jgi:hypothetical protein